MHVTVLRCRAKHAGTTCELSVAAGPVGCDPPTMPPPNATGVVSSAYRRGNSVGHDYAPRPLHNGVVHCEVPDEMRQRMNAGGGSYATRTASSRGLCRCSLCVEALTPHLRANAENESKIVDVYINLMHRFVDAHINYESCRPNRSSDETCAAQRLVRCRMGTALSCTKGDAVPAAVANDVPVRHARGARDRRRHDTAGRRTHLPRERVVAPRCRSRAGSEPYGSGGHWVDGSWRLATAGSPFLSCRARRDAGQRWRIRAVQVP